MKATSIPAHERSFLNGGLDSHGKKFVFKRTTRAIPGSTEEVEIIDTRRDNNDNSFYFTEVVPKERIVLHFTAGYLKGDIATLTTPQHHVSVPYVIGRGGEIYRLWDDKYWSYHLGPGASGGNTAMSKRSIAIELSNIAWLERAGDQLVSSYSREDVYCTMADKGFYVMLSRPFRDRTYFASFTDAQYDSLSKLLKLLLAQYPAIQPRLLDNSVRYEYLPDPTAYQCIMSHVNFRPAGKWDIGPAFEWDKIVL